MSVEIASTATNTTAWSIDATACLGKAQVGRNIEEKHTHRVLPSSKMTVFHCRPNSTFLTQYVIRLPFQEAEAAKGVLNSIYDLYREESMWNIRLLCLYSSLWSVVSILCFGLHNLCAALRAEALFFVFFLAASVYWIFFGLLCFLYDGTNL